MKDRRFAKKIVLFDFDGVMVDSFEIGYQAALKTGSKLTREEDRKLFEGNVYEAVKELEGDNASSNDEAFFAEYVPMLFGLLPVEGMAGVLEELSEASQLIVVSSSISSPINGFLSMHHLDRHFDKIMGSDVHRNKTVKIDMVLKEYKAKPQDCVFVTDTLGDMREAAKCKVQSIGVTWGFHERWRLEKGNFFALVDKIEELVPAIHSFFKK